MYYGISFQPQHSPAQLLGLYLLYNELTEAQKACDFLRSNRFEKGSHDSSQYYFKTEASIFFLLRTTPTALLNVLKHGRRHQGKGENNSLKNLLLQQS